MAKPYYSDQNVTIFCAKCEDVLPTLQENSVDTVITDPPYGLSFMGKTWDHGVPSSEVWSAVLRVCKPGAMMLAFGGTRTYHRLACAIEDAGWEIRDCMMWLYGSGFPKSLDISKAIDKAAGAEREIIGRRLDVNGTPVGRDFENGKKHEGYQRPWRDRPANQQATAYATAPSTDAAKLWDGWGSALKPAWEPIIVAMKPLDGTFAENAQTHGVAGMNIDGGRIHAPDARGGAYIVKRLKPGATLEATGGNWRPQDGPMYRGEMKPGRWPANLIIDEEAARLLDQQTGELSSNSGKPFNRNSDKHRNAYAAFEGRREEAGYYGDSGGASRFFYTAKASRSDRGAGNDHPTVKPTDLLKYLCKLTATPTGGTILDPFAGSGTTLVAGREMGRPVIGIEMEPDHCRICVDRLSQGVLFGAEVPA